MRKRKSLMLVTCVVFIGFVGLINSIYSRSGKDQLDLLKLNVEALAEGEGSGSDCVVVGGFCIVIGSDNKPIIRSGIKIK